MKSKLTILNVLLVAAIAILFFVEATNRYSSAKEKVAWEYQIVKTHPSWKSAAEDFNKLGADEWELVAIQQPSQELGDYYYIFKRAKRQ